MWHQIDKFKRLLLSWLLNLKPDVRIQPQACQNVSETNTMNPNTKG